MKQFWLHYLFKIQLGPGCKCIFIAQTLSCTSTRILSIHALSRELCPPLTVKQQPENMQSKISEDKNGGFVVIFYLFLGLFLVK